MTGAELLRGPDCILWQGGQSMGYGIINGGSGQPMRVHRFVYLAFVGSIPRGRDFHVHHKCGTKLCINLDHLEVIEAGTHRYLHHPRPTHCLRGHELSAPNAYVRHDTGARQCRICMGIRARKRYKSKKVEHACFDCGAVFVARSDARFCSGRCEAHWYYHHVVKATLV